MERKWWKEAVVYQVYPRSFMDSNGDGIGDLNGIREKLDYIKTLGADVIWLCPIYQSPNVDNGYDISDYQEIMSEFGTMDDFEKLLAEAHEKGLRIVLDLVVNHSSNQHRWFQESRKSKDNPYREYYYWKEGKPDIPPNNWGSIFGGSAWTYDETSASWYFHLFTPEQPDLNWESPKLREEVFSMMRWWFDKGIDGFRMDVINYISKPEGEWPDGDPGLDTRFGVGLYADAEAFIVNGHRVHEFLREMNEKVLSQYDVMTVGETAQVTIEHAKKYAGFDTHELNMVFEFEHMNLDYGKYGMWSDNRIRLTNLKQSMNKWQKGLEGCAWNSLFWANHDHPRLVSRFADDSEEYRETAAKMLATCLYGMQGTPYIYQGDELGMTNVNFERLEEYQDVQTRNAYHILTQQGVPEKTVLYYMQCKSRDNARTPMQWNDSENAGFTTGKPWIKVNPNYTFINAAKEMADKNSVFSYYQQFLQFRKKNMVLNYGQFDLVEEDSEELFAYTRTLEEKKLFVACNFTKKEIPLKIEKYLEQGKKLFGNYRDIQDGILRPYEAVIYGNY